MSRELGFVILIASVVTIVVLVGILIAVFVKKRNRMDLHQVTGYGNVDVYGEKKDFVIEVDGRFRFLVHKGKIVSYQDRDRCDHMIDYAGGGQV